MRLIIPIIFLLFTINVFGQKSKQPEFNLYPDKKDGKWGYLKKKKKLVINYQFEEAYRFKEELALVRQDGKYGFINSTGNFEIDCIYDDASSFNGGFAWIRKDSLEGLLNKDGTLFMKKYFINITQFYDGLARVVLKNDSLNTELKEPFLYAFFDKKGNHFFYQYFSSASIFMNGRAKVGISDEYFFLDTLGRLSYRKKEEFEVKPYASHKFVEVDEMPKFPGGERGLRSYIAYQLRYPALAREFGIEGIVYVRFKINTKGKVENAEVVGKVHELLDKEALRVVNSLPKWEPANKDGKPVNVYYTVPIGFTIK